MDLPGDVMNFVKACFPEKEQAEAIALLLRAQVEGFNENSARLLRCTVVASRGSLTSLKHYIALLAVDWRDVIVAGEYETQGKELVRVRDLNQPLQCSSYEPSPQLAEQVRLRDGTCVFPWCQRPARACDLDHIIAHADGGETSSSNLACLCRLHHRMKTHGGWSYAMVEPGVFLWRSPRGYTWLRDRTGTTDLTPPPVEPPER